MNIIEIFCKWELQEDISFYIPQKYKLPDFENEWITIKNNYATIRKGYAWDGCSPKLRLFGKIIVGTWDGPVEKLTGKQACYLCSLIHDVLYQFNICDRKTADDIFLAVGRKFILIGVYYRFVRIFGGLWYSNFEKQINKDEDNEDN